MGTDKGGDRLSYAFSAHPVALALHTTKGLLGSGRTFKENVSDAMTVVPLRKNGMFGDKNAKGSRYVRVYRCLNPVEKAYEFAAKASKGFVSMTTLQNKGWIRRMGDGTIITYRYYSSSRDHSSVVEVSVRNFKRVKSQKIHFVGSE